MPHGGGADGVSQLILMLVQHGLGLIFGRIGGAVAKFNKAFPQNKL